MNMIELTGLEKSYPLAAGRQWVLRNINLGIREGDFLSIMGPSGSGKTSLLSVLGLLDSDRSEEHTSELQSLMRLSYAVFCLKKKNIINEQCAIMTKDTYQCAE